MPKYCSVPNCRSDSGSGGERKSFYKLPLQEPLRLQQWLRNMGRESWSPSRHQYVCHQHFAPSCFKVRWGIRYLDADAVPTIFPEAEKRKAADQREGTPKRLRAEEAQSFSVSGVGTTAPDPADAQSEPQTLRLLEFAVADPSLQGETFLMESLRTQADSQLSADGVKAGVNFPLTLYQTVDELVNGGGAAELVMMSENAAGGGQVELVTGVAAFLCPGGVLVLNDPPPGGQDLASDPEDVLQVHKGQEAVAYFETVPDVRTQLAAPPDTVLSSALSSKPIPSTLPIVSKHAPPPPPVLSPERLDGDEGEDGEDMSDADEEEQEDQQLEEHCYHKSSLSKEQLEATVGELQKKVKVLQQRHRRHLEKLLGLENTVSQLRQSNLLNEERLQLLERAYLQTSAAVSEAGGTVAIIYEEEDDAAYFYTRLDEDRQ